MSEPNKNLPPGLTLEQAEAQTVEAFMAWRSARRTVPGVGIEFWRPGAVKWMPTSDPSFDSNVFYRIKPAPQKVRRPFTQAEACRWRLFKPNDSAIYQPSLFGVNSIHFQAGASYDYLALMEYWSCSNDGVTWHLCYVEEEK